METSDNLSDVTVRRRTFFVIRALRKIELPLDPDDCWLWTGTRNDRGYPQARDDSGERVYVHRLIFEMEHGDIPKGMQIHHACGVKLCVNPSHLRLVTPKEHYAIHAEMRKAAA